MLDFATKTLEGNYTREELMKAISKMQNGILIPSAVLDPLGGIYNFTMARKNQKKLVDSRWEIAEQLFGKDDTYHAKVCWNYITGLITLELTPSVIEAEYEDLGENND